MKPNYIVYFQMANISISDSLKFAVEFTETPKEETPLACDETNVFIPTLLCMNSVTPDADDPGLLVKIRTTDVH